MSGLEKRLRRRLAWLAVGVCAVLSSCAAEAPDSPAATAVTRAALVIEPPELAVGSTATVELAVVTPPEHRVAPIAPPEQVAGVWILEVLAPEVESSRERRVHRFRFHVRARDTGRFVWPAQEVRVETPDGTVELVPVAARPFDVVPVLPAEQGALRFFPLQAPGPRRSGASPWLAALGGALGSLALVGAFLVFRRLRPGADAAPTEPATAGPPSWRQVQTALAAAREVAAGEPLRAADMASAALRLHASRRFGIAALPATTEELQRLVAPAAAGDRWPALLGIWRELDQVRFLPEADAVGATQRVEAAIDRGAALAAEDVPRGYGPPAERHHREPAR